MYRVFKAVKAVLVLLVIVVMSSPVYARSVSSRGVRGPIFRADGGVPSTTQSADSVNMKGWSKALIYFSCDSSAQGWEVTPLFGDTVSDKYIPGETTTISGDTVLEIDVYETEDFYVQAEGATGTPAMSIIILGVNQKVD